MNNKVLSKLAFLFFYLQALRAKTSASGKNLSLQRMDAISDLSALALKYFSEDRQVESFDRLKAITATSEAVTALASELSGIWDETGSAAYTLTRLAKLIDERDPQTGEYTPLARILRAMASNSQQRNVHMSMADENQEGWSDEGDEFADFEEDETDEEGSNEVSHNDVVNDVSEELDQDLKEMYKTSPQDSLDREALEIEQLYRIGEFSVADERVAQWIEARWLDEGLDNSERLLIAFTDINEAGARGHHSLFSAFIRLGRKNSEILAFSPEEKAEIAENFMNASDAQLTPNVMKWLLTVDTFREDQIKLLKMVEGAAEQSLKDGRRNSITEMFAELQQIPSNDEAVEEIIANERKEPEDTPAANEQPKKPRETLTEVKKRPIKNGEEKKDKTQDEPKSSDKEPKKREESPIKQKDSTEPTSDSLMSWYIILMFLFVMITILACITVAYFIRAWRLISDTNL